MSDGQQRPTSPQGDLHARLAAVEVVIEAILPIVCEKHHICRSQLASIVDEMRDRRAHLDGKLDDSGRFLTDQLLARVETYLSALAPQREP